MIFEIPLPTKDPELVEEVIKVLIDHIESKMNAKVDKLHTFVNQPKIVPSFEDLNKSLQEWYLQRSIKRTSESSSKGSKKKAIVNMIKATDTKEKLRYEIEEVAHCVGSQGDSCKQRKDQQIWFIDEDQGKIMKMHKKLEKNMPQMIGRASEKKCVILEKEIELLWQKVVVYETYGNSERELRIKAVEALERFGKRFIRSEKDISEEDTKERDEES